MDIVERIKADRTQARRQDDPNADICFLALADDGRASVRTLVMRDIIGNGFTVFMNRSSPKWQALARGADYEALLWYPTMQRQYRISGQFQELEPGVIADNWPRRPLGSKYLDYVYEELGDQSAVIESRQVLLDKVGELKSRFRQEDMTTPTKATGVTLMAERIECLDLNNQDRIHDRRAHYFDGGQWREETLLP